MRAVIIQSNYIPWKGYFDLILNADLCIFLDSVQFTKNDWRNRNKILSESGGDVWLSIPVGQSISRRIKDVELPLNDWRKKHLAVFETHYQRSPFFKRAFEIFSQEINSDHARLSTLNQNLIEKISKEFFNSDTEFINDYEIIEDVESLERNARILTILKAVKANEYLSGPSASSYIDLNAFNSQNIDVQFASYAGYPPYPQHGSEFRDDVSVLDLISWNGDRSIEFIKGKDLITS